MYMFRLTVLYLVILVLFPLSYSYCDDVLLFDDFNGPSLNSSVWSLGTWDIGSKTQFGNAPLFYSESGTTFASLIMDTYNPQSPGSKVLGTEIWSQQKFDVGNGIEFEARVRALDVTPGQICSYFTYDGGRSKGKWVSDEIDIEIVTTKPQYEVLFTSWNDWVDGSNNYGDGIHHLGEYLSIPGYNYQDWNVYKFRWYTDRVEWYVNGNLVNTHTSPVPDRATPIRANFWAAGSEWAEAYDSSLQPTANPASNVRYYYDIDYIKVTRLGGGLQAPTNLSASLSGSTVNLAWHDNSSSEDGFEIFRAQKPNGRSAPDFQSIGTSGANIANFSDNPGNGSWIYRVRSYASGNFSAYSNEVTVSLGSTRGGGKNSRN